MVKLYSNNCVKCMILKGMLDNAKIPYEVSCDFKQLIKEGFRSAPVLELEDGTKMIFEDAVKYISEKRG